jgi:hypothetical protein
VPNTFLPARFSYVSRPALFPREGDPEVGGIQYPVGNGALHACACRIADSRRSRAICSCSRRSRCDADIRALLPEPRTIGHHGAVYVTNNGTSNSGGELLRLVG